MTDVTYDDDDTMPEPGEGGTGVKRPDQSGVTGPGEAPGAPASGGRGSEGAGGPDGFGTGT